MQMQILLVKDSMGKAIFAHAVRKKAVDADGYAAQRLAEDLAWLAYTRLILKSDGENAITCLLRNFESSQNAVAGPGEVRATSSVRLEVKRLHRKRSEVGQRATADHEAVP